MRKELLKLLEILILLIKENAIKSIFLAGFNFPTLNFIGNLGYSLIILIGAIFMLQGKITP